MDWHSIRYGGDGLSLGDCPVPAESSEAEKIGICRRVTRNSDNDDDGSTN
jgi:hypothetical protein